MRAVAATHAAPRALRAELAPAPIRCLHLAASAVHLAVGERQAISLVADLALASPCAIVVPELFAEPPLLRACAAGGVAEAKGLFFPGLQVVATRARRWSARPAWETVRGRSVASVAADCGIAGMTHGAEAGWLVPGACALVESLLPFDSAAATRGVEALLGRGPGLTPAGDDVLLGALHAVWCLGGDDADCERRCRGMLPDDLVSKTTTLSSSWLGAAALGEAAAPWHALVGAWGIGDSKAVASAIAGVAAIGASSGRAMLLGFGAVLGRAEQLAQPAG